MKAVRIMKINSHLDMLKGSGWHPVRRNWGQQEIMALGLAEWLKW
jgi:hypothetical protein